MKNSLNKKETKLFNQLEALIVKYGYWSDEVRDFNSTLDFSLMNKLNNMSEARRTHKYKSIAF